VTLWSRVKPSDGLAGCGGAGSAEGATPAPAATKPPTPEELAEMVRAAVREELATLKGTAGES